MVYPRILARRTAIFRSTPLLSPKELKERLPLPDPCQVAKGRQSLIRALEGSERPVIIMGPCSIHDPESALEYGSRLADLQRQVIDELLLVMRVYLEKPRTALGWKGYLLEPHLNSCDPLEGLQKGRKLLIELTEMGVPIAMEFLTPYLPLYLGDLVTWGCIGARTSASPLHRQIASSLDMPCGFKNSIDGSVDSAMTGIWVAAKPDRFLGIDERGSPALIESNGNPYCHLVLRGGAMGPNYSNVSSYQELLRQKGLSDKILIDCSHDNSRKDFTIQSSVFKAALKEPHLLGLMIESHLHEGRQSLGEGSLDYGVSITDGCIGWSETEDLILDAASRRTLQDGQRLRI